MAIPLSVQRQQQKKKKFEKELVNFLKNVPSNFLKNELKRSFLSENPPNATEFVRMVSSAKFGGENKWISGAQGFKSILRVVNSLYPKFQENLDMFDDDEAIGFSYIETTFLGYMFHYMQFFPKLRRYLTTLHLEDFRCAREISPYLFLEKETNAYGFLLLPIQTITASETEQLIQNVDLWNKDIPWVTKGFPNWTPNSKFSTGPLEYISPFVFYFGTIQELGDLIPAREQLDVSGHFRQLQSGKKVSVSSYSKRKPINAKTITDDITNKIVYRVYDHTGQLRYIGEGKPDRYLHVNSGASHNTEINRHFFLNGKMRVEIIKEGLTKVESLAFEKMLLNQSKGTGLWNKKDYEPFEDYSLKGFSEEEVSIYVFQNEKE